MLIRERSPGDLKHLRLLARREKNAEQKDRLMSAVLAIERAETADIQKALNRSRGFVQRWAYAYRDGGIQALKDKPRGGSTAKISGENVLKLKARVDAGPTQEDKVCTPPYCVARICNASQGRAQHRGLAHQRVPPAAQDGLLLPGPKATPREAGS